MLNQPKMKVICEVIASKRHKWLKVKSGQVVYLQQLQTWSLLANFRCRVNAHKVDSEMRLDVNLPGGAELIQRHVRRSQIDFNLLQRSFLKQEKHHWSQGSQSVPSIISTPQWGRSWRVGGLSQPWSKRQGTHQIICQLIAGIIFGTNHHSKTNSHLRLVLSWWFEDWAEYDRWNKGRKWKLLQKKPSAFEPRLLKRRC